MKIRKDAVEDMIQKHLNPEWFLDLKDKLVMDANKEVKHSWFDMLLKSNIDQDEITSLGLSTVMMAKKVKELIKEEKLTIADLEGVGLEMLNNRLDLDIEDMYLLKVQGKLHHQKLEYENDFINAILHNIRRVVIKNKIEDTQLEVHKFYDGTLLKVQENLQKMLKENRLGYGNVNLKGREWTVNDLKRSKAMLESIEKTLKHTEQTRRHEEYVGGRPTTIDLCSFIRP
nr:hypothetical protein [Tanacetum cinerariifolium]